MPETPPDALEVQPSPPAPSPWQPIADGLRQHPGEWRRITGHPAATVATTNITRGVLAPFRPAGTFEARRTEGNLLIRYLGTEAEQARKVGALLERGIG